MRQALPLCLSALLFSLSTDAQLDIPIGQTVKVTGANQLFLVDNLSNNGTIEHLTLTGTTAQSISGTGTIGSLVLNKASGTATITSGMQSLTELLTLSSGILAANGGLTLKSTATGTARVASHALGTGNVTGNVVVERYIDIQGRAKQWRMLGLPYSAAVPLTSISGFTIDYAPATRSMMYYFEGTDDGKYGTTDVPRNAGYVSFTQSSESVPLKHGVMAWLYGNSGGTANGSGSMSGSLTIVSSGPLNEDGNAVSMPVSYTSARCPTCGWNLVSNPFASAIDWNSGAITKTNLDAAVYRYDPQFVRWTTHTGTSGTNTADRYIESGGALFVKANAASPVLTIGQDAKVSGGSAYTHFGKSPMRMELPSERAPDNAPRLAGVRISVSGQGNPGTDEAYVDLSRSDATEVFDSRYDAETMGRSGGAGVSVKGSKDIQHAQLFDRPISETGVERRYYPLKVTSPSKGATTIELKTEGDWNPLNSVTLIDKKEGRTMLVKDGALSYPFTMDELQSPDRFILAINHVKVDDAGRLSGFDVKLLGNPVRGEMLDMLVLHPSAQASKWSLLDKSGRTVGTGSFIEGGKSIQHRVSVPGMRQPGVYVLRVAMDNGDERSLQVMKN